MVNVALDFFTILVLKMGVSGAAWATITAQAVSGILCLLYMKKKFTILKMNEDEWRPDAHYMTVSYTHLDVYKRQSYKRGYIR